MSFSTYRDINHPFLVSTMSSPFPLYKQWYNQPLSQQTFIAPNRAGYRPYGRVVNVNTVEPFGNPCAVYQTACDQNLPSNRCYRFNHEIVHQP